MLQIRCLISTISFIKPAVYLPEETIACKTNQICKKGIFLFTTISSLIVSIPYSPVNTAVINYLTHQEVICAQYPNAFIILYNTQILGPFWTVKEAYRKAFELYEIGTFLVKYCGDIKDEKK